MASASTRRRIIILLLGIAAIPVILMGGLKLFRRVFFPTPIEAFDSNEKAIREYISNLKAGRIPKIRENEYYVLDVLANDGATHVQREGDCIVVTFGFLPPDDVPQLWYCPRGFEKLPASLSELKAQKPYFELKRIRDDWVYCKWND